MFSGIVSHKAKVLKVKFHNDYMNLEIYAPKNFAKGLKKGASVSVNGVCLTSKDTGKNGLSFDVIQETLDRTNLGQISKAVSYTHLTLPTMFEV